MEINKLNKKEKWIEAMIERGKPEIIKVIDNVNKLGMTKEIFEGVDTEIINKLIFQYLIGNINEDVNGLFVYIFKCNEYYKIGVAEDVKDRWDNIQVGNPYNLEIIFAKRKKDAYLEENKIHTLFDNKRIRGEWFKLELEDIEKIKEMLCLQKNKKKQ